MHPGVPHLPVNLEWLVGLDGALVKNPAVGGESYLLTTRVSGLGFIEDGRIRWVLTIPCWRPSLFIFGVCCRLKEKLGQEMINGLRLCAWSFVEVRNLGSK